MYDDRNYTPIYKCAFCPETPTWVVSIWSDCGGSMLEEHEQWVVTCDKHRTEAFS